MQYDLPLPRRISKEVEQPTVLRYSILMDEWMDSSSHYPFHNEIESHRFCLLFEREVRQHNLLVGYDVEVQVGEAMKFNDSGNLQGYAIVSLEFKDKDKALLFKQSCLRPTL